MTATSFPASVSCADAPLYRLDAPCPTCGGPLIFLPIRGYGVCFDFDCPDLNSYLEIGGKLVAICDRCGRRLSACTCKED